MKEPLFFKIKLKLYHFFSNIYGHDYCCCRNPFHNCKKCGFYLELEEDRREEYERQRR